MSKDKTSNWSDSYADAVAAAEPTNPNLNRDHDLDLLFNVAAIIGQVRKSSQGSLTPREAAFLIIANHGADGEYMFPNADGTDVIVGVMGISGKSE